MAVTKVLLVHPSVSVLLGLRVIVNRLTDNHVDSFGLENSYIIILRKRDPFVLSCIS